MGCTPVLGDFLLYGVIGSNSNRLSQSMEKLYTFFKIPSLILYFDLIHSLTYSK